MLEDITRYCCSLGFLWYREVRYHRLRYHTISMVPWLYTLGGHAPKIGFEINKWRKKMVQVHRKRGSGLVMCSGRSFWPQLSGRTTRPWQQFLFIRKRTSTASPRTFIIKHCRVWRVLQGHQQGGQHVCHPTKLTCFFLHAPAHTCMRATKVKVEYMEDRLYIHRNYCMC